MLAPGVRGGSVRMVIRFGGHVRQYLLSLVARAGVLTWSPLVGVASVQLHVCFDMEASLEQPVTNVTKL